MDDLSLEAYLPQLGAGMVGLTMLWLRSSGAEMKAWHPPILLSTRKDQQSVGSWSIWYCLTALATTGPPLCPRNATSTPKDNGELLQCTCTTAQYPNSDAVRCLTASLDPCRLRLVHLWASASPQQPFLVSTPSSRLRGRHAFCHRRLLLHRRDLGRLLGLYCPWRLSRLRIWPGSTTHHMPTPADSRQ